MEGSDNMTVGHTVDCFDDSMVYTEGNWITIESVGSRVVSECVKSKLYYVFEASLY